MSGFELAHPLWLLGLPLLPLLAWHHHRGARRGALLYSRLPSVAASRPGGGAWTLHLPVYLRLAALALLLLALARPRLVDTWEEATRHGIDIQITLDVSASMATTDLAPDRDPSRPLGLDAGPDAGLPSGALAAGTRLALARSVVRDFIGGRPADRLGLTIFSGTALTRSPLTTDRRVLAELVGALEPDALGEGTAIGVALASAAARLHAARAVPDAESPGERGEQIIVLVTDGANNTGEIDPGAAAALAAGLGIRVYAVAVGGLGTEEGAAAPGAPPEAELDEDLLRRIAARTGGRFYRATDPRALAAIFTDIDRLERSEVETRRRVRHREIYPPFAWAALGFLLLPLATGVAGLTAET